MTKVAILPKEAEATPLITTRAGASGYGQPHIVDDLYANRPNREYTDASPALRSGRNGLKVIPVAQRGRGDNNAQQFEFRDEETANALTTVQKDSMVMTVGNYSPSGHNATRIVDPDGVPPTVMENHGQVTAITEDDKD